MSEEPPAPPAALPTAVVDALAELTPAQLRDAAAYAEALAEHEEREDRLEAAAARGEEREQFEDRPDGVPAKATTTIKEINGNRYYYWQWRDGEKIRSQYERPVSADE